MIIYLAIQLARGHGPKVRPEDNFVFRLARRVLPISAADNGPRMFVREKGRWQGTQLLLVLVVVESVDVVFAIDSVPAIFGVTRDPFIVFSSNMMAILGLRALYFLLADFIDRFQYLSYGLSGVLIFIGGTMIADYAAKQFHWLPEGRHELIPYRCVAGGDRHDIDRRDRASWDRPGGGSRTEESSDLLVPSLRL